MFKRVLFDLDGTITQPFEGISNSILYALEKLGEPPCDREQLKQFIGPPLLQTFGQGFNFPPRKTEEAVRLYREYYSGKGIFECGVYEGVEPLLRELKARGVEVGLATCKPENFAKRLLEHFNLSRYFDDISGATSDTSRNEKAQVIAYALEKAGDIDKSTVLMVGDRFYDVLGAKANGIACAGVTYGYGSAEELKSAGADFIADAPCDVLKLL